MTNRTTLFIVILIYLSSLFFLFGAIGDDIAIDYSSTDAVFGQTISFLGMDITIGSGFLSNIVVSIATLPLWFNTIFIVIPAILMFTFGILMFIPTIPSG